MFSISPLEIAIVVGLIAAALVCLAIAFRQRSG
jgi:hypothetical protein